MPPKNKTQSDPAADAAAEATTPEPIKVEWRGRTFEIPGNIMSDARFRLALRSPDPAVVAYEALGPVDASRFVMTLQRGEDANTVLAEFLDALATAAGWGNGNASR